MKSRNSIWLITLLVITTLVLVACGGDDGGNEAEDAPLPTNAPTLDTSSSEGDTSQSGPPIGDDQGDGSVNTDSGPPLDNSAPPGGESPIDSEVSVVTDFSLLAVGRVARVSGLLTLQDDEASGNQMALLTDNQGNELLLSGFPIEILAGQDGEQVSLDGTISPAAEGDSRLILEISGPGAAGSFDPAANSGSSDLPPGIMDDAETTGGPFSFDPASGPTELTTLSVQLGANLTALQTYDELFLNLSADLLGAELLEISGTSSEGWTLQFRVAEQNATVFYLVAPDGTVQQSSPTSLEDLPVTALNPIDRSRVMVDSDVALSLLSEANSGPVVSLVLRATAEGGIEWQLNGFPGTPIDATTAP